MIPEPCMCGADDCERCYPEVRWQRESDRAEYEADWCEPDPGEPTGYEWDGP